jgi:hypothetical protein
MKKIFTLLFLAFFAVQVNAQESDAKPQTTEAVKPAVIPAAVEEALSMKETEFDFGKIPQGKPVTHVFEVKNVGKDSLKIVNVQASCGCTTPEWEHDKAVAPKGTTKINVGYNAAAAGPFTKFITITYNGTLTKQITIKGEVWQTPAASAPENKATQDLKNN